MKFPVLDTIKEGAIVYPNCDGDAFDNNWSELIEKIKGFSEKNIVVSISTKFSISENVLEGLEEINQMLQSNNGMLKISVSFSCIQKIGILEENTASYLERLRLVKKLTDKKIPYFTIIKPLLPFVDFNDYKKIVDDTIELCPYYVIGDLYVNVNSKFYQEYIENKNYLVQEKSVSWNGQNGVWKTVVHGELKNKVKRYIIQSGGKVFESDKDAIIYIGEQRRDLQ